MLFATILHCSVYDNNYEDFMSEDGFGVEYLVGFKVYTSTQLLMRARFLTSR